ncbi:MAG TPA: hypothetical protein DCR14_20385 [Acidimicrobiaceae bacterium]|nr:hypothetical protein [Acidimicrobiaceae bacterium]
MGRVAKSIGSALVLALAVVAGAVAVPSTDVGSGLDQAIDLPAQVIDHADRLDVVLPPLPTTGFDSLFIGHSFFQPVAERLAFHAPNAGFVDHTQTVVFSGGATGAPKALWDNPTKRAEIQAVLDRGTIELFGMTYHPDHPTIEGYQNWVNYALMRNPHTTFFVAFPWLTNPGSYSASAFASTWSSAYNTIAKGIIDDLRSQFRGVRFFAIPYGQSAAELYTRFSQGNLPDVSALVASNGTGVFRDSFGHAGFILRELATLVWLDAIYGVDLATYDFDPGYTTDLKAIATAIMDAHDPEYNLP